MGVRKISDHCRIETGKIYVIWRCACCGVNFFPQSGHFSLAVYMFELGELSSFWDKLIYPIFKQRINVKTLRYFFNCNKYDLTTISSPNETVFSHP